MLTPLRPEVDFDVPTAGEDAMLPPVLPSPPTFSFDWPPGDVPICSEDLLDDAAPDSDFAGKEPFGEGCKALLAGFDEVDGKDCTQKSR